MQISLLILHSRLAVRGYLQSIEDFLHLLETKLFPSYHKILEHESLPLCAFRE